MFGWFSKGKPSIEECVETPEEVERRWVDRQGTFADVVAVSENGRYVKKGVALDLSANGTRLRFENGDSLVDGMVVKIARYGIKRKGRMRWRTRTDVGIEFLDEVE